MWRLFYIESVPGCIFSTQTRSADISSKINCWEWLIESETKTSAVTWQHAYYHSWNRCGSSVFPGITRIKLSNHANAADWYMWNITDVHPCEKVIGFFFQNEIWSRLLDINRLCLICIKRSIEEVKMCQIYKRGYQKGPSDETLKKADINFAMSSSVIVLRWRWVYLTIKCAIYPSFP